MSGKIREKLDIAEYQSRYRQKLVQGRAEGKSHFETVTGAIRHMKENYEDLKKVKGVKNGLDSIRRN